MGLWVWFLTSALHIGANGHLDRIKIEHHGIMTQSKTNILAQSARNRPQDLDVHTHPTAAEEDGLRHRRLRK